MYRHVFIISIKDGVSEELLEKKMQEMRDMKLTVSEIEDIRVNRTLGWIGDSNQVCMAIDVKDKAAFDAVTSSPAHTQVAAKAEEAFDLSSAVFAQIEI